MKGCFPSPRPSPLGRGRTNRRPTKYGAAGLAGQTSDFQRRPRHLFPLPGGEGQGEGKGCTPIDCDANAPGGIISASRFNRSEPQRPAGTHGRDARATKNQA